MHVSVCACESVQVYTHIFLYNLMCNGRVITFLIVHFVIDTYVFIGMRDVGVFACVCRCVCDVIVYVLRCVCVCVCKRRECGDRHLT